MVRDMEAVDRLTDVLLLSHLHLHMAWEHCTSSEVVDTSALAIPNFVLADHGTALLAFSDCPCVRLFRW